MTSWYDEEISSKAPANGRDLSLAMPCNDAPSAQIQVSSAIFEPKVSVDSSVDHQVIAKLKTRGQYVMYVARFWRACPVLLMCTHVDVFITDAT